MTAQIDTGAGATIINPQVVKDLDLRPIGVESVIVAASTVVYDCETYYVDLHFPEGITIHDHRVICLPLAHQSFQCLIGRDILEKAVLVYVGHLNQYTLSF
jgi:predicted aspartyl protease